MYVCMYVCMYVTTFEKVYREKEKELHIQQNYQLELQNMKFWIVIVGSHIMKNNIWRKSGVYIYTIL